MNLKEIDKEDIYHIALGAYLFLALWGARASFTAAGWLETIGLIVAIPFAILLMVPYFIFRHKEKSNPGCIVSVGGFFLLMCFSFIIPFTFAFIYTDYFGQEVKLTTPLAESRYERVGSDSRFGRGAELVSGKSGYNLVFDAEINGKRKSLKANKIPFENAPKTGDIYTITVRHSIAGVLIVKIEKLD